MAYVLRLLHKKMKFSIKDFFTFTVKQETVHLVTFTEEILNG